MISDTGASPFVELVSQTDSALTKSSSEQSCSIILTSCFAASDISNSLVIPGKIFDESEGVNILLFLIKKTFEAPPL